MEPDSETLVEQAWSLRELDPTQSIALLNRLGQHQDLQAVLGAKINVVRSFHFSRVFDFRQTLDAAAVALEVLSGIDAPLWLARSYGRLAIGFHCLGDLSNAYRHFQLQIEFASYCEPDEQREELFYAHHNLARHLFQTGSHELADQSYMKAYEFTAPNEYLFGYLQVNHAQCLIKQEKYDAAKAQINAALEIGLRLNIARICIYALPGLAKLAEVSNNPQEAERLYLEAVKFASDNDLPGCEVYLQLTEFYLAIGRLDQAKVTVKLAAEMDRGSDDGIHAMRVEEVKVSIYESLGDYKTALVHHKAFHQSQMSLFSTERDNKHYAQGVARRIEVLEKEYASLELHNRELKKRLKVISELKDKADKISETDTLTGLFNRRHLKLESQLIFDAGEQLNQYVSVAVVDVDHFKQVNDQLGHQTGDAVLRQIADIMRGCMRGTDLLVRYGGDEFVVVMPNTRHEHALSVLQRLRNSISVFDWEGLQSGLKITVSSGLGCELKPRGIDELFRLADKRLYQAKKMGRNLVVGEEAVEVG